MRKGFQFSVFSLFVFVPSWLILLPGCAMERSIEVACDTARLIGVTLAEKVNLEQSSAAAGAEIEDPTYRVMVLYVQGVLLEVGLDGVEVKGRISGHGGGTDKPLTAETIEALRQRGLGQDDIETLLQILKTENRKPNIGADP
ncbi:MAG: hypothetical protein KAY37_00980 [Phycisphaerae bacterium]|nr:hypothetical protein [Phycisphaerae bacterium]